MLCFNGHGLLHPPEALPLSIELLLEPLSKLGLGELKSIEADDDWRELKSIPGELGKSVAAWLGVPKRSVAVTAGGKSRVKTVSVAGEPARLAALVAAQVAALQ